MWGKHYSFPHKTLWIAIVFPYMIFFVMIFPKLFLWILLGKTLWIATVFFLMIFFSKIIFVDFFNIELVENLAL
jgi:hypothetical protein